jgi:hypothetical protein
MSMDGRGRCEKRRAARGREPAFGDGSIANGNTASAFGQGAEASADRATALGCDVRSAELILGSPPKATGKA